MADAVQKPTGRQITSLMVLTFTSGVVDAVGFIALGHVFCALVTGNVLFLGLAVAGEPQLAVSNTATALGAFVCGLALGHRWIARLRDRGRAWFRAVVAAEAGLLLTAAGVSWGLAVGTPGGLSGRHYVVVGLLALAMGARTAATHRLGVPGMVTVLVTTTLSLLLWRGTHGGRPTDAPAVRLRHLLTVLSIGVGAGVGALLLDLGLVVPLLVTAAGAGVACVLADGRGQGPDAARPAAANA